MASLLTIGDFKYFDEYSKTILKFVQYPDAGWKFSWPYALYLQKTGEYAACIADFAQSAIEPLSANGSETS